MTDPNPIQPDAPEQVIQRAAKALDLDATDLSTLPAQDLARILAALGDVRGDSATFAKVNLAADAEVIVGRMSIEAGWWD